MDALPELLSETVGDATVIETIDIGGGDAVSVTREATHIYRSDGLLSDESVETFGHDTERLSIRTKRRKSEIRLETLDTDTGFTVPSKAVDSILEAMIEGVLRTTDVIDADEDVVAQFRFSELTLVVTDRRIFEHVGSAVWDGDFETVDYADLTGLKFEKGSVATQVVLETADRRRRVKVPNEHAGRVRREIQNAVFGYHDVSSLESLQTALSDEESDAETAEAQAAVDSERERRIQNNAGTTNSAESEAHDDFVSADWTPSTAREENESAPWEMDRQNEAFDTDEGRRSPTKQATVETGSLTAEIETLTQRVEAISTQLDEQTELIESQQQLIEQLVDELRRGR